MSTGPQGQGPSRRGGTQEVQEEVCDRAWGEVKEARGGVAVCPSPPQTSSWQGEELAGTGRWGWTSGPLRVMAGPWFCAAR